MNTNQFKCIVRTENINTGNFDEDYFIFSSDLNHIPALLKELKAESNHVEAYICLDVMVLQENVYVQQKGYTVHHGRYFVNSTGGSNED